MKKLIVSIQNPTEAFNDFKKALKEAQSGKKLEPRYEICFDNKRDFDKFVRNINILSTILVFKPKSVYELAKISNMDVSNLNKVILFFEEIGAIKIKEQKLNGRTLKTPVVEYSKIEFDLKVA